jgi:hypothetical protein
MSNSLDVHVNHIMKYSVDLIKPEEYKKVYSKTSTSGGESPMRQQLWVSLGLI